MAVNVYTNFTSYKTEVDALKTKLDSIKSTYTSEISSANTTAGQVSFTSWDDEIGGLFSTAFNTTVKDECIGGINNDLTSGGFNQLYDQVTKLQTEVGNAVTAKSNRDKYPHYDDAEKKIVNSSWSSYNSSLNSCITRINSILTNITRIEYNKTVTISNPTGERPDALGFGESGTTADLLAHANDVWDYISNRPLGEEQYQMMDFGEDGGVQMTYYDGTTTPETFDMDQTYPADDITVGDSSLTRLQAHNDYNPDGNKTSSTSVSEWSDGDGSEVNFTTRYYNDQGQETGYDRDTIDPETGEVLSRAHVDYHYDSEGNKIGYDYYRIYPDGTMTLNRYGENYHSYESIRVNPDGSYSHSVENADGSKTTTQYDAQGNVIRTY